MEVIRLTAAEARKYCPSCMDNSPRKTQEEIRDEILGHVAEGRILMDASFQEYPVPIPSIEFEMMKRMRMDVSHIRPVNPDEISRIMRLFDWNKLILEAMAE